MIKIRKKKEKHTSRYFAGEKVDEKFVKLLFAIIKFFTFGKFDISSSGFRDNSGQLHIVKLLIDVEL